MFDASLAFLTIRATARWVGVLLVTLLLYACGGGGSDPNQPPAPTPGILVGQVVKGLTSGATVSLYSLDENGQRTLLASSVSDAQGGFRITRTLDPGRVYLMEAVGGTYVNEITGQTETLSSPLRGVFVASGSEPVFSISALSEAVAIDAEQATGAARWGPAAINRANDRIKAAFDLPGIMSLRFADLSLLTSNSTLNLLDDEINFSVQAGVFAGFWDELRRRTTGLTLAQALPKFHQSAMGSGDDTELGIALIAGLVRYVESVPILQSRKALIFQSAGLPADTNSQVFDGAQSSGRAAIRVPDQQLRLMEAQPFGHVGEPGRDTFFDERGALLASRLGTPSAGLGLRHVGNASVADVYGSNDVAIGRWNHGYYYPGGVSRDAVTGRFVTDNLPMQALSSTDLVYAAGRPATNLPACGTVTMSARAQTAAFRSGGGLRTLTLDPSSRIAVHTANGQTKVGYTIVLRDDQGQTYTISTLGGHFAPWTGETMNAYQEFSSSGSAWLPTADFITVRGLLTSDGGTKAVVKVLTAVPFYEAGALAAVFERDGETRPCTPVTYSAGSVSPVPATGDYIVSLFNVALLQTGLQFLPNGTPLFANLTDVTESTGVEKAGNGLAGIGLLIPPFNNAFGGGYATPQPYVYLKASAAPVISQTATGTLIYRLVASTSLVAKSGNQLITVAPPFTTATLTIDLDQSFQLTTFSPVFGTCHLTVQGASFQPGPGFFNKADGTCSNPGGNGYFVGGILGGDHSQAVIRFEDQSLGTGGAGLLFERVP